MKWTKEHDVLLGKEAMLFELWKYKLGSRERGNCLDRIAESLNQLQEPFFNVSQKSIRDRLKILERDFKRKDRFERNASGISPEKSEIDVVMEDYLERKEEQERESEKIPIKQLKKKLPPKKCETKPWNFLVRQRKEKQIINRGRRENIHQGRIQDFFKEGVVSMRVQGKHLRAKKMG